MLRMVIVHISDDCGVAHLLFQYLEFDFESFESASVYLLYVDNGTYV